MNNDTKNKSAAFYEVQEYVNLKNKIEKAGTLNRSYWYYLLIFLTDITVFTLSIFVIFYAQNLWLVAIFAAVFGFFAVRMGGLMHDAGHQAIFKSEKNNDIAGFFFATLAVIAFAGWKSSHNAHHANPNQEDEDPNVDLPLLSFNLERYEAKKGLAKMLRKYQMYLYYPLIFGVGFGMRIADLFYFKQSLKIQKLWQLEIFLLAFSVLYIAPFFLFPLVKALIVVGVANIVTGFYFSSIFAPNHKGMYEPKKGEKLSFLKHQIITSRNIYAHPITDYVFMGLNYQIEHHLFPMCPRNKLKYITPYVRSVCKQQKLEFSKVSFFRSNLIILESLKTVVTKARTI